MSANLTDWFRSALNAQGAYALFNRRAVTDALTRVSEGDFTQNEVTRFLASPSNPEGFLLVAHTADDNVGFSASVFQTAGAQNILSVRGTAGALDLIQDAKLSLLGFANDQTISL